MVIIDGVINTLLGGQTLDPTGMHCPSWDDAFVSSFVFCWSLLMFLMFLISLFMLFYVLCPADNVFLSMLLFVCYYCAVYSPL